MAMPEQVRYISVNEIDEDIIPKIREVNVYSDAFKILSNSIKEDHQRHPITLRLLTDVEKALTKSEAIYGIIDGHHRYRIARKNGQLTIPSFVISGTGDTDSDVIADCKLALRLNESSIKMSPKEKGKVLYELAEKTKLNVIELAEEIFGIRTSMAYHCLNAYKKSIGEKVVTKPRKQKEFKISSLRSAWRKVIKYKNVPTDVTESADCLEAIKELERLLREYKRLLTQTDDVANELENRKGE